MEIEYGDFTALVLIYYTPAFYDGMRSLDPRNAAALEEAVARLQGLAL